MNGSKLIDLRDCQNFEYQRIFQNVDRIRWEMHGFLAHWAFRVFGKAHKLKLYCWSRQWEYPWAVLNADLFPGLVILDAGCGASPLLPYLAWNWKNLSLYGVDIGEDPKAHIPLKLKLLKVLGYVQAEGYHPALDTRIHFRQECLSKMSFNDGFFDRVFCISVLEHIPIEIQSRAIQEMSRVLKPGGRLVITLDLPKDEPPAPCNIVRSSGLQLMGSLDYSVNRAIRHGHNYEVAGLVLKKLS